MSQTDNRSFIYQINQKDIITYINPEWFEFAHENNYKVIDNDSILGTSLWHHVVDPQTIQIYKTLIQKVRDGNDSIKVFYRCDSPETRRFMEMKITSSDEQEVMFINSILKEENRPAVALLDPAYPRNQQMISMCGWCKKVRTNGSWLETEDAIIELKIFDEPEIPQITHGICPSCKTDLTRSHLN
jgi:hypothetical protein